MGIRVAIFARGPGPGLWVPALTAGSIELLGARIASSFLAQGCLSLPYGSSRPDRETEVAYLGIELRRGLKVADVPGAGDDCKPCAWYRFVELVRDGQWRPRVGIAPDK